VNSTMLRASSRCRLSTSCPSVMGSSTVPHATHVVRIVEGTLRVCHRAPFPRNRLAARPGGSLPEVANVSRSCMSARAHRERGVTPRPNRTPGFLGASIPGGPHCGARCLRYGDEGPEPPVPSSVAGSNRRRTDSRAEPQPWAAGGGPSPPLGSPSPRSEVRASWSRGRGTSRRDGASEGVIGRPAFRWAPVSRTDSRFAFAAPPAAHTFDWADVRGQTAAANRLY
jgi:hypothetical protein